MSNHFRVIKILLSCELRVVKGDEWHSLQICESSLKPRNPSELVQDLRLKPLILVEPSLS